MIRILVAALVVLACRPGPAWAQLEEPIASRPAVTTHLPSQVVAERIRAALADPRNARGLDEVVAAVSPSASDAVHSPVAAPVGQPADGAWSAFGLPPAWQERLERSRAGVTAAATRLRAVLPAQLVRASGSSATPWSLVVVLLVLLALRRRERAAGRVQRRSVETARRLARRGLASAEVARRTGLSQDVVRALRTRPAPREVA